MIDTIERFEKNNLFPDKPSHNTPVGVSDKVKNHISFIRCRKFDFNKRQCLGSVVPSDVKYSVYVLNFINFFC
jgi:hypothetical protein